MSNDTKTAADAPEMAHKALDAYARNEDEPTAVGSLAVAVAQIRALPPAPLPADVQAEEATDGRR